MIFAFFPLFHRRRRGIFGSLSSFLCGHAHFMADLKANIILPSHSRLTFFKPAAASPIRSPAWTLWTLSKIEIQSCRCQFTKNARWQCFYFLPPKCNWIPQSSLFNVHDTMKTSTQDENQLENLWLLKNHHLMLLASHQVSHKKYCNWFQPEMVASQQSDG